MKARCIKSHVIRTKATGMYYHEKFIKVFEIGEGATGVATSREDRIMVRLDVPLTATNEKDAPYASNLYRVFLKDSCEKEMWEFSEV